MKKTIYITSSVKVTFEDIHPAFCQPDQIAGPGKVIETFRNFGFQNTRAIAFEIIKNIPGIEICRIMKK